MNFSEIFVDSLLYPFTNIKRFISLIILFFASFLIIPALIAYGYMLRIIEYSLKGENKLPDFDHKIELLGEGINFLVVSLVYGIPSLLITFILINQFSLNTISVNLILTNPLYMIISIILGFLISLVFTIGLVNMVYEKNIRAAFNFKRIFQLIKMIGSKKYVAYIAVYSLITNLLSLITIIIIIPSMFPASLGGSSFLGLFTLINVLIETYIRVFGSRFKGLIYPLKLEQT
jgi:hypothetical protein